MRSCKKYIKQQNVQTSSKESMNPIDYWYNESRDFRRFIDEYGLRWMPLLSDDGLSMDVELIFNKPSVIDKLQVLSLLSVIRILEDQTC